MACRSDMRCLDCNHDNPAGMKFCNECGAGLPRPCERCGFANPPNAKFCGQCASRLDQAPAESIDTGDAERRRLTVMFVDLVGSTQLSRSLDPEDYRELLARYQSVCGEIVHELDGHIAQHLGDGILVYFGYPRAHADAPQRALDAALRVVPAVENLAGSKHKLQVRIGLHSGLVVVGSVGSGRERLALGEVPNVAARLQSLAGAGRVLVSADTERLVRDHFDLESLGKHELKGLDKAVEVFEAVRGSRRLDPAAVSARLRAPLTGFDAELKQLEEAWSEVKGGQGRAVWVRGGPGMGKSSLAQTLTRLARTEAQHVIEVAASGGYQNTAFHVARSMLGVSHSGTPDRWYADVLNECAQESLPEEAERCLRSLLGLPPPEGLPPADWTPARQRERTFALLLSWLSGQAAPGPALLVLDDVQWCDVSTQEAVARLVDNVPAGLMVLLISREEFAPEWGDKDSLQRIELSKMAPEQAELIVNTVPGSSELTPAVRQAIVERAEGVPLYLVEFTKSAVEAGGHTVETIPATLHDSLVARLDALGGAKAVAQTASVAGRTFELAMVASLTGLSEEALQSYIDQLVEAQVLEPPKTSGLSTHAFRHILIRDAAYESLLRSTRESLHTKTASWLESQRPDLVAQAPEVRARHLALAGDVVGASEGYAGAAMRDLERSAYVEAIAHFEKALEHLGRAENVSDAESRELGLRTALGFAWLMTRGYAAPEVEQTYSRALELCVRQEAPPLRVLYGLWAVQLVRGSIENTAKLLPSFVDRCDHEDAATRLLSNACVAAHAFLTGDFEKSSQHARVAMDLYDLGLVPTLVQEHGLDGVHYGHVYCLWNAATQGDVERCDELVELITKEAETVGDPYTGCVARSFMASAARDLGQPERALELVKTQIEVAQEHGLLYWQACAECVHGWALSQLGDAEAGVKALRAGVAMLEMLGARVPLPYYISFLVEAELLAGRPSASRKELDRAFSFLETDLDKHHEPELLRLRGTLELQSGRATQGLQDLRQAEQLAAARGAHTQRLNAIEAWLSAAQEPADVEAARNAASAALEQVNPRRLAVAGRVQQLLER